MTPTFSKQETVLEFPYAAFGEDEEQLSIRESNKMLTAILQSFMQQQTFTCSGVWAECNKYSIDYAVFKKFFDKFTKAECEQGTLKVVPSAFPEDMIFQPTHAFRKVSRDLI